MTDYKNIPPNLIEQVRTVRDYDISYDTLHTKAILKDRQSERTIKVPYSAYTNKYKDALSTIIITKELDDYKKRYFWYRPKSVSLYYYGNTELWADILIINNCAALREFTPDKLKIYDPDRLKKFINEIMILEQVYY